MTDHVADRALQVLLEDIRAKYISPSDFWKLYTKSERTIRVLTVNLEILKALHSNRECLDRSTVCTIDSAVLQRAMERTFRQRFERLTGREIVELSPSHLSDRRVLLFGATQKTRDLAVSRYRNLVGTDRLVYSFDEPAAVGQTVPFEATLGAFFAYGYPKQEWKIDEFLALNPDRPALLIGVGGAIDYFAGTVPRPPEIVARTGFEWLWRLFTQPRLRIRRISAIAPFALHLVAHSHRHRD